MLIKELFIFKVLIKQFTTCMNLDTNSNRKRCGRKVMRLIFC